MKTHCYAQVADGEPGMSVMSIARLILDEFFGERFSIWANNLEMRFYREVILPRVEASGEPWWFEVTDDEIYHWLSRVAAGPPRSHPLTVVLQNYRSCCTCDVGSRPYKPAPQPSGDYPAFTSEMVGDPEALP